MSDPLMQRVKKEVGGDISALKFAKLHSPKMKSVYWQHFGFPTNEQDHIITKQNVVCTLCHKVLTNHGNTTNLRAHLMHRHKAVFDKICAENGIRVPPRKPTPAKAVPNSPAAVAMARTIKREPAERKIKLEYAMTTQEESYGAGGASGEDHSMLYETMVPMTYDDDEVIDADHFAKVEVSGGVMHRSGGASGAPIKRRASNDLLDESVLKMQCKSNRSGGGGGGATQNFHIIEEVVDPYQLQDAVVNLLVQDLHNVETLYDGGMAQFIRTLSGQATVPSLKKIEDQIKELHSDKLTTLADQIKVHSQLKPFSLGFEIWTNVENKHFLSIFYNYTTSAPDYNLLNQLYCTFEYNKFTAIDAVFEEFNLQNCTAAIVSYDYDDYLKHFLRNKNIPIILSYEVTVDKCLRNVFALPAIASVIEEVKEVIMRYTSEIASKDVEVPTLNEEFPWTYYELLKFFSETVSWPDDVDMLVSSAKTISDMLSTLSVTLDTLKGEEIPHSSMLSPITSKILNKQLAIAQTDDEFVTSIKTTVATELQKRVIADDHLTIAALLDPRFHRLTNINNFSSCLQILTERFNKMCESEGYTATSSAAASTVKEASVKPNTSNARKSNLELFFDIQEVESSSTPRQESNVEQDLKRYRNEVYVSLDESPFLWWNKMGHMYGSLKELSCLYQCVPCVVNMSFKKPINQQIYEHQKRFMLAGNLIDAILFLHHNNK